MAISTSRTDGSEGTGIDGEVAFDAYGYLLTNNAAARFVWSQLAFQGAFLTSWTDGCGTVYTILFSRPSSKPPIGRGLQDAHLFISIPGHGCWGFDKKSTAFPSYVSEKMGMGISSTLEKLTEFINILLAY